MIEQARCPYCGGLRPETDACSSCGHSLADTLAEATVADDEQTRSAADQTRSDHDQTWADSDQTGSDRDQQNADEDQAASDADFALGSDAEQHGRTTSARARTARDRAAVAGLRGETADARLQTAEERDLAAAQRDREADERDRLMRETDAELGAAPNLEAALLRAERDRAHAALDRARAAEDRARAAADRAAAARDRADSLHAQAEARHNLRLAATDELTGAWTRTLGLPAVVREIERARRTGNELVLAFVDVDGLKELNDTSGHAAGDRLLVLVAETIRAHVRLYDVLVRYGGDEFLCAMPNCALGAAKDRMEAVANRLRKADAQHSITFGLVALEADEGIDELIARADADLLRERKRRRA